MCEGGTTKDQQQTLGGHAYLNYLVCGGSFTAVCNLPHCAIQTNAVYFMSVLSPQNCLKQILKIKK